MKARLTQLELRYYDWRAKLARFLLCKAQLHADRWSLLRSDDRVAITAMRPFRETLDVTIEAHDFTLDDLMTALKYARELRDVEKSLRLNEKQ